MGMEFVRASTQYIDCGNASSLNVGAIGQSYGICFWVKGSVPNTDASYVSKYTGAPSPLDFVCWGADPGDLFIFYITSPGKYVQATDSSAVFNNVWHLVTGVVNRNTDYMHIYIDAILNNSTDISAISISMQNANPITIGSRPAGSCPVDALIDDVRIYNRLLSLAEIQTIYHSRGADNIVNGLVGRWLMNEKSDGVTASGANSCIDISGNGNHGTPQNSPVYKATPMKLIKPTIFLTDVVSAPPPPPSLATIVSIPITGDSVPDEAMIIKEDTVGTGNLKYYISRHSGDYTLVTPNIMTDISAQPSGQVMRVKVVISGDSELENIGLAW